MYVLLRYILLFRFYNLTRSGPLQSPETTDLAALTVLFYDLVDGGYTSRSRRSGHWSPEIGQEERRQRRPQSTSTTVAFPNGRSLSPWLPLMSVPMATGQVLLYRVGCYGNPSSWLCPVMMFWWLRVVGIETSVGRRRFEMVKTEYY